MFEKMSVQQYTEILASHNPTPGGGSALAIIGANACAMVEMAVNVTANKLANKGESTTDYAIIADNLANIRNNLLALADQDAQAFDGVISALRLPKDTDENKTLRAEALQRAYVVGAQVPLQLMELCVTAYGIADTVIAIADKFVVSDAVIGKNILAEVARNSLHNVTVNTSCLTDEQQRAELETKAQELIDKLN